MFYRVIERADTKFKRRIRVLGVLFLCAFVVIMIRVGWLQIVQGERFLQLSRTSRIRLIPLPNPRGLVRDREGEVVAGNSASFSVGVMPEDIDEAKNVLPRLKEVLPELNIDICREKIENAPDPFRPVVLKREVSLSKVTYLLEREQKFPSVVILAQPLRRYPQEKILGNCLGYLGEVNKRELKKLSFLGVEQGDLVGKMGIEKRYNSYLQGEKGGKQVEVDAYGRIINVISEKKPVPGNTVYLTIDLDMQNIAREEMGQREGAVLIADPHTGEILVMLSLPSFDPNLFASGISEQRWKQISNHPGHPLQNKAVKGEYPPASTFKIVLVTAGLEEGIITPSTTFKPCLGSYRVGNRVFKCWKEQGHGKLALKQALSESCDVYFYQLGLKLGIKNIIKYSRLFGLGKPTGVDLSSEEDGFLPTVEWKKKARGEIWYPGDTANLSIGQGFVLVTPIQMLNMINAVANGGYLPRPFLVKKIVSPEDEVIFQHSPEKLDKVPISDSTLSFFRETLREVVVEGTGWRAQNQVVKVAGKTGTAEIEGKENPHNWFIGYAPADNPSLSIVVLVENRKEDISVAPQIAGRIFSRIFKTQKI